MKDMVERINVEQGAITRHVGEMRAGVTGEDWRDIVRREMVDALDVRNVSMIPQPDMKNIIVQQASSHSSKKGDSMTHSRLLSPPMTRPW